MEPGSLMAEVSWWRMENVYDDATAEIQHSNVRENLFIYVK